MLQIKANVMTAHWNDTRMRNASLIEQQLSDAGNIDVEILRASQDESTWETVKRGLLELSDGYTHHLLIQDDVKLTENFPALVRNAITARPSDVLTLFANRKDVNDARGSNTPWATAAGIWGQSWVMPVGLIEDFLEWNSSHVDPDFPHDDTRVSLYVRYGTEKSVWSPIPSLVEHVGHNDSELGNSPPVDRTATWFEADLSPADVNYENQTDPVTISASNIEDTYGDHVDPAIFE